MLFCNNTEAWQQFELIGSRPFWKLQSMQVHCVNNSLIETIQFRLMVDNIHNIKEDKAKIFFFHLYCWILFKIAIEMWFRIVGDKLLGIWSILFVCENSFWWNLQQIRRDFIIAATSTHSPKIPQKCSW